MTLKKVYIPHYTPLEDRKDSILSTCYELGLEAKLIQVYDKEKLPSSITASGESEVEWNNRVKKILPIIRRNANLDDSNTEVPTWATYRKLNEAEVSLTYKHFLCLLQIAASKEKGMIFEDDILAKPDSKKTLQYAMTKLGKNCDYVDLGGGCELPTYQSDITLDSEGQLIETSPPRSRTTAAYGVTPEAALKIAAELFPCIFPIDWAFQYIFIKHKMKVVWTNPACLLHGSKESMTSSIQKN